MTESQNSNSNEKDENMTTSHVTPSSLSSVASARTLSQPGTALLGTGLETRGVHAWFGKKHVLSDITLDFAAGTVTALIGPSGCGKSTFIRTLNRIMVFQKPNPFPSMTIGQNVLSGLKLAQIKKSNTDDLLESCLTRAGLWSEVKDRLGEHGGALSGGQQQRLCIARSLAVEPQVLLMDEPCSALDPGSTFRIEETIADLAKSMTIVIVTHNMQQAARVSDYTAFFLSDGGPGEMIEAAPTSRIFSSPQDKRTEDYVTGRFG